MENKIKETTKKLNNGTITKDEADKILLDLFGVIESKKINMNNYIGKSSSKQRWTQDYRDLL